MLHLDKNGNLVVTIEINEHSTIMDEIETRREALYDAINEHNNKDFIGSDLHYGLTKLLKDFEPTPQQWNKILNNR